jgi:WD40 repeat protein
MPRPRLAIAWVVQNVLPEVAFMARVFVSYAGADLARAHEICEWLREDGHDPFMDRDRRGGILGGEVWKERLHRELRRADAVVCVVTAAFVASEWCAREMWIADALQRHLVPFLLDPEIRHPIFETVQHVDYLADPADARDRLLRTLRDLDARGRVQWQEGRNPFPGLDPFTAELSGMFFGRSREGRELAGRLQAAAGGGLLAVVGPSGCGKSSLMRAELLPRLGEESGWLTVPAWLPGDDPLHALAGALTAAARTVSVEWSLPEVLERLDDDIGLRRLADDLLLAGSGPRRLLIAIDQAEELFTQTTDSGCRDQLARLVRDATRGPVLVVLTMRSVFLDDLRTVPGLVDVPLDVYALAPLATTMLRLVIEEPARIAGLRIDPELVTRLVADTGGGEALPMLAFTLQQLAEGLSRGDVLSANLYDSLGGVHAALARRADAANRTAVARSGLTDKQILTGLVRLASLDDTGRRTRHRIRYATLSEPMRAAADIFVDHRLLTTTQDTHGTWIGIAHEALLTAWPPLDNAISEQSVALHTVRSVERAAAEWVDADRAEHFLWDVERVDSTLTNLTLPTDQVGAGTETVDIPTDARTFLLASHDRAMVTREKENRTRRRRVTSLTALAVVAVTAAVVAFYQAIQANSQRDTATARSLTAQAEAVRDTSPELALKLGVAAQAVHADSKTTASLADTLTGTNYLTTITGFAGPMMDVTFRRDSQTLATGVSASEDTVILWDTGDRTEPHRHAPPLTTHRRPVWRTAFSPDGDTLATASEDRTVVLWDTSEPTRPRKRAEPLTAHTWAVNAVAFSPDGSVLVTASGDMTAILWNVADPAHPEPLSTLRGHTDGIEAVAFSPDGRVLATGGWDNTVFLWDITDPLAPHRIGSPITAHTGRVNAIAFSPTEPVLATASADKTAILWDVTDLLQPRKLSTLTRHARAVDAVEFSPDGRTLATGGGDNIALLWDVVDPARPLQLGRPLAGHSDVVSDISFNSDGHTLATSSWDGTVILWDTTTPVQTLDRHIGPVHTAAFSPDGRTLATGSEDNTVILWDVSDPTRPRQLGQPLTGYTSDVLSVAFSSDRRTLATASADNQVILWNVADPAQPYQLGRPFTGHALSVSNVAFSPDGRLLATGGSDDAVSEVGNHSVILWDVTDPEVPRQYDTPLIGHGNFVEAIDFEPDGRVLASADTSGEIFLWDVKDPGEPRAFGPPAKSYTGWVQAAAFDRVLVTGGWNGAVILWDVTDPTRVHEAGRALTGHVNGASASEWQPNMVQAVTLSPDGRTLATASEDTTVTVWDISDPTRPRTIGPALTGHTSPVEAVTFHPTRRLLATGSEDNTVRLWDLARIADIRDNTTERACERIETNLTPDEWHRYVGESYPYQETCR